MPDKKSLLPLGLIHLKKNPPRVHIEMYESKLLFCEIYENK